MSLKDLENLDSYDRRSKSKWANLEDGGPAVMGFGDSGSDSWFWMLVVFKLSGRTAFFLSWKSQHGPRITSRNHCLWTQFSAPSTKAHLKWTEAKWENCSVVRWFEIWKEFHFKKPSSLIVCGYISTYRSVSLHIWNSNSNIQFLEHMLPSCWCFFSFQGRPFTFQQENTKPHTAAINTARLWGRVQALNWLVCSPDLSPA